MRVPSAEELAAIAAAYLAVAPHDDARPRIEAPRWRLAGRFARLDVTRARFAARAVSRWSAAGRLDG
ncbi:MAG TPA: hypothetical protein VFB22_10870 [Candidatus Baltobacteraceae bacterium]|nr:hypothetical protein [Candidatus Baltobacteraceae bacterium]